MDRWWAQNCIYVFFFFFCKAIKGICEKKKNYVFRELIAQFKVAVNSTCQMMSDMMSEKGKQEKLN